MARLFFIIGSVSAFFAVALGAFSAHALKNHLSPEMLNIFEVGVRYHFYHTFALFIVAFASDRWPGSGIPAAGWFFLAGIIIFSGSLYLLSITGLRWLGAITPIGGLAFLLGWLLLARGVWR